MAPAVARVSASLDPNDVTIYYPADKRSATALAYRKEDLARQQRDPSYEAPCCEIANPRLPSTKLDDDDELEKDLKRKLCDFLGYSEQDDDRNTRQQLVASQGHTFAPSAGRRPEPRVPIQGDQGHVRYHNPEFTTGFADHARYIATKQADRLPHALNSDRYRNNTSPYLAPPNPAMVTRPLPSAPAWSAPQSYGPKPQVSNSSQPVSRPPTPRSRQQPVAGPQYAAGTGSAMDVRQPGRMAQQEHLQRAQQQSRSGSSPVAQYQGVSPSMKRPGMMPTSTSYRPLTSQRMPTTTALQQQRRTPPSISNAPMRPQSTPPPGPSSRMAQSPPSGGAWSPQSLSAMPTGQNKSPGTRDLRRDSPQMAPVRNSTPLGAWLGSATSQARQPHSWAGRPPSPSRFGIGAAQPAYLTADRQFFVPQSIEDKFSQAVVPTAPMRTREQYQSIRQLRQLQDTKRQDEQNSVWRKMKGDMANDTSRSEVKSGAHNAAQSRSTGPHATAKHDKDTGRISGATLAAQSNLDIPTDAAAAAHSLIRTPVDSRPPPEVSSHYMASRPQQQSMSLGASRNGSFQDAGLNRLFPPVPDGQGGEVQVPIEYSEHEIMLLLNGHRPLLRNIQDMDPQGRRRHLQQWCSTYAGHANDFLQAQSLAIGSQPRRQHPSPPRKQHETRREALTQPPGISQQQRGMPEQQQSVAQQQTGRTSRDVRLCGGSNVQRTDMTGAQLASPPTGGTSQSPRLSTAPSSKIAPYSVGGKAGCHPIPAEIQRIVGAIQGLEKTNSGFPIRRLLKGFEDGLFAQNGTLLKGNGSKGKSLLEWFGDERLFSADEWHYLRYTVTRSD